MEIVIGELSLSDEHKIVTIIYTYYTDTHTQIYIYIHTHIHFYSLVCMHNWVRAPPQV